MNIEQRADKRESEKETTTQQPIINLLSERRTTGGGSFQRYLQPSACISCTVITFIAER